MTLKEEIALATQTEKRPEGVSKTAYLEKLRLKLAPSMLDARQILNEVPIWPLTINIFSACFCMGCSALYHLMYAKNQAYQSTLARLDYGGISILVFGTSFPILYYSLACSQVVRKCSISAVRNES